MLIFRFCQHSENQRPKLLGGLVIWNFSVWSILTKWQPFFNFFIMANADILFPSTLGKPETQTFGGVSNLKFFHTIDINEIAVIFQFFHNGWCWYSISIDTQKTRDPNFGGSVIWNFSIWSILMKWQPFFNFFIMTKADIPLTLGKLEMWIFHWFSFPNFSIGSVFPITHLRFCFNIYAWLHIKHSCMDIYAWWPFCTLSKKVPKEICQNRLKHLCVAVVNRLGDSSSHQIW